MTVLLVMDCIYFKFTIADNDVIENSKRRDF